MLFLYFAVSVLGAVDMLKTAAAPEQEPNVALKTGSRHMTRVCRADKNGGRASGANGIFDSK